MLGQPRRRCVANGISAAALLLGLLLTAGCLAAASATPGVVFPPPLESYADAQMDTLFGVLRHRVAVEPFNLWATVLFLGAVLHTFFTHKFRHLAHVLEERRRRSAPDSAAASAPSAGAAVLHFLGEVEAVFGIWVVPLVVLMAVRVGFPQTLHYINEGVGYNEPVFVVVIMAMASTRPVLTLAETCLRWFAGLGGGRPAAWWASILTLGPLLGSCITEPAAMTISASLLAKQFYERKPTPRFAYATLGLLFVNISVGGVLTHFAAPPVLMVAAAWRWDTAFMVTQFGWKAFVGILAANGLYYAVFRRDFAGLGQPANDHAAFVEGQVNPQPIPAWVTAGHLLFMAWTVLNAHHPVFLVGGFLFFLAFFEVTQQHQARLDLRPPILVGFFLAGLVIHGGLQQWWIAPVLSRLSEVPLMLGATALTAVNDNAAITYLATLVPGMTDTMKYAVVAGAVAGGGLTVIANAPNPAGQSILGRYFANGISPAGLFLGALVPTVIVGLCLMLL
jgi:hypothetical protein